MSDPHDRCDRCGTASAALALVNDYDFWCPACVTVPQTLTSLQALDCVRYWLEARQPDDFADPVVYHEVRQLRGALARRGRGSEHVLAAVLADLGAR